MKISVMLLVSIVFLSLLYSSSSSANFLYNEDRKEADLGWHGTCKNGKRQSPINIDTSALQKGTKKARFKNYDKQISGNISNEHDSVQITFNNTNDVEFDSGEHGSYRLHSMHFHWRCTEHKFNNKSYQVELHMVHYNQTLGNFKNVESSSGGIGLSVIGVLFKVQESGDNKAINSVLKMIKNGNTRDTEIKYRDLLPAKLKHVYQYQGSLTTPPCTENVLWHVLDEKATISPEQLKEFERLHPKAQFPNCRQTKPLNERKVTSIEISSAAYSFMFRFSLRSQIFFFVMSALLSRYLFT
ncbi:carbonic anhydrase 2-like isoform X2 [Planococcus citri]|uniref:carbonic anhydrase 2-like isoform X2 n=1 Tax=Planococcus citri TaxID=170843 RepID=UPI0031F8C229